MSWSQTTAGVMASHVIKFDRQPPSTPPVRRNATVLTTRLVFNLLGVGGGALGRPSLCHTRIGLRSASAAVPGRGNITGVSCRAAK